jgi:hypothetical protein
MICAQPLLIIESLVSSCFRSESKPKNALKIICYRLQLKAKCTALLSILQSKWPRLVDNLELSLLESFLCVIS